MKHIPTIFLMLILLTIWSCEDMGDPSLEGCMDQTACNYNADATIDDDTCTFTQENYDCNGACIATNPNDCCEEGITPDCNGECGGSAMEDCAGTCGGSAENDECGVCGGDNSTCNISYSGFIKPTFVSNGCTGCHGTQGGLNLSSHTSLMLGNSNHGPVVIPLNGSGSLLIQKLRGTAPNGVQMPANSGCCLDDGGAPTIDLIEIWIDEGAENN